MPSMRHCKRYFKLPNFRSVDPRHQLNLARFGSGREGEPLNRLAGRSFANTTHGFDIMPSSPPISLNSGLLGNPQDLCDGRPADSLTPGESDRIDLHGLGVVYCSARKLQALESVAGGLCVAPGARQLTRLLDSPGLTSPPRCNHALHGTRGRGKSACLYLNFSGALSVIEYYTSGSGQVALRQPKVVNPSTGPRTPRAPPGASSPQHFRSQD